MCACLKGFAWACSNAKSKSNSLDRYVSFEAKIQDISSLESVCVGPSLVLKKRGHSTSTAKVFLVSSSICLCFTFIFVESEILAPIWTVAVGKAFRQGM